MRIADLGGDAKSLVVALTNGTLQVFSWQGKVRGGNGCSAARGGVRGAAPVQRGCGSDR